MMLLVGTSTRFVEAVAGAPQRAGAQAAIVADGVAVDDGLEGEEGAAVTLWRVQFERVGGVVDIATSSDACIQNWERHAHRPNSGIGSRKRPCCSQAPSRATLGPGLWPCLVPRAICPCRSLRFPC